ncbi:MAG TPA: hypothetical protein DCR81_06510 [Smithella sp.]|nr:hypothetical protein [Smithella sp.]
MAAEKYAELIIGRVQNGLLPKYLFLQEIVKSFQSGFTPFFQNNDGLVIKLRLMYKLCRI